MIVPIRFWRDGAKGAGQVLNGRKWKYFTNESDTGEQEWKKVRNESNTETEPVIRVSFYASVALAENSSDSDVARAVS